MAEIGVEMASTDGSVKRGDTHIMLQGADIIHGKISEVQTILVAVNEAVNSLSTHWDSDARLQFQSAMGEWDQDMVNVVGNLEEIEATLRQTKFTYDKQQYEAMNLSSDFARTLSGLTPSL